jgi:hypothetical protein
MFCFFVSVQNSGNKTNEIKCQKQNRKAKETKSLEKVREIAFGIISLGKYSHKHFCRYFYGFTNWPLKPK